MTNPAYIILLPALFNRAPNGINLPLKVLDKCNIDYCIDRNQDRQHVKKQCLSENPAWPLLQCTAVLQATFTTLIIHKTARGHRNRTQRTRVFYFLVSTVWQLFFPGKSGHLHPRAWRPLHVLWAKLWCFPNPNQVFLLCLNLTRA